MEDLDERAARILDFERRDWRHPGIKDEAIRDELGLSSARYYQVLGALLDEPAALRHDPILIHRLQRLRDERRAARDRRTLQIGRPLV